MGDKRGSSPVVFGPAGGAQVRFWLQGDLRLPAVAGAPLPPRGFFPPAMTIEDGDDSDEVG